MLTEVLGSNSVNSSIFGQETSSNSNPKRELGKDEFLTLLVAQLKNQDPLNPLDSTAFTSQLAQFSSLEQLFGVNKTLADIQKSLTGRTNEDLLGYIGKVVKTSDNAITVEEGEPGSATYSLEDRANVGIKIYDDQGVEVRKINVGWKDPGEYEHGWDGRDNNDNQLSNGIYTFEVDAKDGNGFIVPHTTYCAGEVTGVTYKGDTPYLIVSNKLVTPESIIEVKKPSNE